MFCIICSIFVGCNSWENMEQELDILQHYKTISNKLKKLA